MTLRGVVGAAGIALGLFGVFRLLTQIPADDLLVLALWLVGAVIVHDGVLSPLLVGVGAAIDRFVPARARRYVAGGLIAGATVTVVAIPLIYRRNSQPAVKAILQQNYAANLTLLLAIVAAASLALYAARVVREFRQRPSTANVRPDDDHTSATE